MICYIFLDEDLEHIFFEIFKFFLLGKAVEPISCLGLECEAEIQTVSTAMFIPTMVGGYGQTRQAQMVTSGQRGVSRTSINSAATMSIPGSIF